MGMEIQSVRMLPAEDQTDTLAKAQAMDHAAPSTVGVALPIHTAAQVASPTLVHALMVPSPMVKVSAKVSAKVSVKVPQTGTPMTNVAPKTVV
jgi:hypothetical protein